MKRISLVVVILITILMGCKQATSPSTPSVANTQTKTIINLEGIIAIIQEQEVVLTKDENNNFQGSEVSADFVDKTLNGKQVEFATEFVNAFKNVLHEAGLETIKAEDVSFTPNSDYLSAKVTLTNLEAQEGYAFEGATPDISLTVKGDFTGPIDLSIISGKEVSVEDNTAGISTESLISDNARNVKISVADIFSDAEIKKAVANMVKASFVSKLKTLEINVAEINESSIVLDKENNIASVTLNLTAPSGTSFKEADGSGVTEKAVVLTFTNDLEAFTGLKEIKLDTLNDEDIKPDLSEIVGTVSTGKGWVLSNGTTIIGMRSVTVPKDAGIDPKDISSKIKEKINIEAVTVENTSDEVTGQSVKSTFTLTANAGHLFSGASKTKEIAFEYSLLEGEFKVETEGDFGSVLDVLNTQTGTVTVDITDNIVNTDANGNKLPFEVNGGTAEEPLELVLESTKEGGAAVNGGGILTSLIVSGPNTTVTVGNGVTINGGTSSTGGGVIVKDGGHFILDGGTITGNHSSGDTLGFGGAGVNVIGHFKYNNDGTLYVTNDSGFGQLVNDTSKTYSSAKFTMKSGTITGNSGIRGGGVYVVGADFIMEGGTISGNTANMGGGIYVRGENQPTSVTLNGGIIENNTATHEAINGFATVDKLARGYGGGLNISGSRTSLIPTEVTIEDGFILRNNDATIAGTEIAFYDNYMDINITGGEISHDGATLIDTEEGGQFIFNNGFNDVTATYHNGGKKLVTPEGKFLITNSVFWNTHSHTALSITGGTIQGKNPDTDTPLVNLFKQRSGS